MDNNRNDSREKADTLVSFENNTDTANVNEIQNNQNNDIFKKRIEKLNWMFFIETEKRMDSNKNEDIEKFHNKLFLILFKQISLYIEEINRLNKIISDKNEVNCQKNTAVNYDTNNIQSHLIESIDYQNTISMLKQTNQQLLKKLNEKQSDEDKKKIEIDSLKRQVSFYKDKLQIDLQNKNDFSPINQFPNSIPRGFYSPQKKEDKYIRNNKQMGNSPINKDDSKIKKTNSNSKSNVSPITTNKQMVNKKNTVMTNTKSGNPFAINLKSFIYKGIDSDEIIKGNEELRKMVKTPIDSKSTAKNKLNEMKDSEDYKNLLKYYDDEINELTSFEKFLLIKRNEMANGNKTVDTSISFNITTDDDLPKLPNKSIRNKHFSLPREKSAHKKRQFPMFTSIKIDL